MRKLIYKIWHIRIIRFLFVGSFNTILDLMILNSIVHIFAAPVLIANTVSIIICITISYFLNHSLVFRHKYKASVIGYCKFFIVTGISVLVVQNIVIYILLDTVSLGDICSIGVNHLISCTTLSINLAKISAVIVSMIWNYMLYRYFVFKNKSLASDPDEIIIV